jgi:hypothetical protein
VNRLIGVLVGLLIAALLLMAFRQHRQMMTGLPAPHRLPVTGRGAC